MMGRKVRRIDLNANYAISHCSECEIDAPDEERDGERLEVTTLARQHVRETGHTVHVDYTVSRRYEVAEQVAERTEGDDG